MPVSENKFLRYQLTQTIGKDAADKFLETMTAASTGGGLTATAVKTAGYTAVAGDLVLCNASGGSFTVTLPSSPSDGDRVAVAATTAPGANAVTISGTIVGTQHDGKLYVLGDFIQLQYSSALTAWVTTACQLAHHSCRVTLASAITTNTAATAKKITFDTEAFDIGACFDAATNNRFVVKRAGRYLVTLSARPNSNMANNYYLSHIYVNGAAVANGRIMYSSATPGTNLAPIASTLLDLAAADYIEGYFTAESTNVGCGAAVEDVYMSVAEHS